MQMNIHCIIFFCWREDLGKKLKRSTEINDVREMSERIAALSFMKTREVNLSENFLAYVTLNWMKLTEARVLTAMRIQGNQL